MHADSKQAAKDMLLRARGLIATRGLVKKSYGHPKLGFCAIGALRYALHGSIAQPSVAGTDPSGRAAYLEAFDLLAKCASMRPVKTFNLGSMKSRDVEWYSISAFNDAPTTPQQDVLNLYDEALVLISAEMVVA